MSTTHSRRLPAAAAAPSPAAPSLFSPAPSPAMAPLQPLPQPSPPRLLDQLRHRIRYLHYSLRTERAYVHWVKAFVRFHGLRHPADMGAPEVEAFLAHLVNVGGVSASTHRQALSGLLFLYRQVLGQDLPWMAALQRPVPKRRLPVVLSPDEVARVLSLLEGEHRLFGQLLYGTGLRLAEALALRIKDLEFSRLTLVVRAGKGGKDRAVMLPATLTQPLQAQLSRSHALWRADQLAGLAGVELPHALERKYPRAGLSWGWFCCFRRLMCRWTRAAASSAATMRTNRPSSAPSSRRSRGPASCTRPRRTPCVTPSLPTCFKAATTSAPCRSCWGTQTSAPP